MKIIRAIIVFFVSFTQLIMPSVQTLVAGGERAFFEKWSADAEYTSEYATELEKTPGKDFTILNLTDIQLVNDELYNNYFTIAKETIERLVAEVKPDLITLTGDNAWGTFAYIQTAKLIDSFGIPWAAVMGNHDGQRCPGEFWCAKVMDNCENCLFKFGPEGMGYGNYVINITENGSVIHTLFMMDSHSNIEEDNINGTAGSGYDHFWTEQLDWYKWVVNGISEQEGRTVQSTVFMHIPLVEYNYAWAMAGDEETNAVSEEYSDVAFGVNHEGVYSAPENNGFFTLAKELGSTKDFICGHDHVNNFSIPYEGIRLTYALKTGAGCYWEEELNGGTVVTINSNGETQLYHQYVSPESLSDKVTNFGC